MPTDVGTGEPHRLEHLTGQSTYHRDSKLSLEIRPGCSVYSYGNGNLPVSGIVNSILVPPSRGAAPPSGPRRRAPAIRDAGVE